MKAYRIMHNHLIIIFFFFLPLISNGQAKSDKLDNPDYLLRIGGDDTCGYVNTSGDTIIQLNKYMVCLTDTIESLGIVMTMGYDWIGIDITDNKLFDIFIYDNGPDYVEEGLFRIEKDSLIGYANEKGEIVIKPIYSCAWLFENGKAKVALNCSKKPVEKGEHWVWLSDQWFYIDKEGNRVEE